MAKTQATILRANEVQALAERLRAAAKVDCLPPMTTST
jgi:hypothetical protein